MMRRLAMLAAIALVSVSSSVVATAPAEAAGAVQFTRIQYDSPGTDTGSNYSLITEYVQLKNVSTRTVNRFASNFYLRPGATVTIRTGKGTNTTTTRYWGRSSYVWNNTGDKAYLRTPSGAQMDYCAWTSRGVGYKYC
jgi:hypothetical protein